MKATSFLTRLILFRCVPGWSLLRRKIREVVPAGIGEVSYLEVNTICCNSDVRVTR